MKILQHAASFASVAVIAVITAFTVQVNKTLPAASNTTVIPASCKQLPFSTNGTNQQLKTDSNSISHCKKK